jgi:hypothetical protein
MCLRKNGSMNGVEKEVSDDSLLRLTGQLHRKEVGLVGTPMGQENQCVILLGTYSGGRTE